MQCRDSEDNRDDMCVPPSTRGRAAWPGSHAWWLIHDVLAYSLLKLISFNFLLIILLVVTLGVPQKAPEKACVSVLHHLILK